ncbi:MAG: homoserine dehydrogenase [Candidatus Nitrohelix vancouverensis]|uniref:Homoserine dehydrogenase n=1 Tax=Candidatus Nitrohelix vancouverensis TaxID=2705534 RepID=A0A7T0C375_9BACT|nr:MAG: homoserine dehydrogenase [Candidatus Nitrohelix vancouverensis]
MNPIQVGLIGFGVIGAGVARIAIESRELIASRMGAEINIKKIADLDITTDRGIPLPPGVLTDNADEILNDPEIQVVIELIGGYEPARTFVLKALNEGKHVVTANKALLAKHGEEIFSLAEDKECILGFEASVGGAIPIIRSLREAFAANPIHSIEGIVNGTANYILSEMTDNGSDFETALKDAQDKGFAEADPTFDIEGIDSVHKIAVLTRLAYGANIDIDKIAVEGISKITQEDIQAAAELGYRIKLLAISKYDGHSIDVRVHPTMLCEEHPMAQVNGSFNAIRVCDEWMDENILVGHGAGALPTGSAVMADVIDIARAIISGGVSRIPPQSFPKREIRHIPLRDASDVSSSYFLRLNVQDRPGALADISSVLEKYAISIESALQKGRGEKGKGVPLMIMTHTAKEDNIRKALESVSSLECVIDKPVLIRVEI